jgi:endonuclease/exonuclease/phosphatase family metal-dependent hydrolase
MRSLCVPVLAFAAAVLVATPLHAQTTITLSTPSTQETDTTIRGGTYANSNFAGQPLVTKAHSDASLVRRALLKFDTENTIPAGATITSARLTMTVVSGGSDISRPIGVYSVTSSFQSTEATWNIRKTSYSWSTPGGDLVSASPSPVSVSNLAGTKVTFDVTKLVQAAVSAPSGASRYTRVGLVDAGAASDNSMRTFASSNDATAASRPVLTVVYGAAIAPSPTPAPTTSTLRVLQYNTHHGGWGTDGVWNVDRLIASALKTNPDIISFNEMERGTSWSKGGDDLQLFLASIQRQSGHTWYGVFVTGSGGSTGIGNAILSRVPFVAHSTYQLSYGRAIVHAQIAWNGRIVNFFSTHLDADYTSKRLTEIDEAQPWAKTFAENRIICGDFNASQGSSEWNDMLQNYQDAWYQAKNAGTAVSYPANPGGNTRNGRIDFVWTSKGASQLTLVGAQVFDTRDASGVQPSDHRPVMAIYSVK